MSDEASTAEREIITQRTFPFPPAAMWKAWTDPLLVAEWWGPNGFTNTITEFDLRAGGHWHLTMHGPDGTDYPNHNVFADIVPLEKIVIDHVSEPRFQINATFTDLQTETHVRFRMLFETVEGYHAVKDMVIVCNEQLFDRLHQVLQAQL